MNKLQDVVNILPVVVWSSPYLNTTVGVIISNTSWNNKIYIWYRVIERQLQPAICCPRNISLNYTLLYGKYNTYTNMIIILWNLGNKKKLE